MYISRSFVEIKKSSLELGLRL